jgi:hypothetical protein
LSRGQKQPAAAKKDEFRVRYYQILCSKEVESSGVL